MASLLATGAGAADGLESILEQMFKEQMATRQQNEAERKNRFDEGSKVADLNQRATDRQDALDAKNKATDDATQAKQDALQLRRINMRPIGSDVTPGEMSDDLKSGISLGNYTFRPANMGMSDPEKGEIGPTGEVRQWRGTQDQISKAATVGKHADDKGSVHDTPDGLVRIYGDGTTEPVLDDNGKRVRGYHNPAQPIVVQTGDGPRLADRGTGESKPILGDDQQPLGNKPTAQTQTMMEGAQMLRPHVANLENMAIELDKRGMFGPIASRMRQLEHKYGTMLDSQDVDTQAQAMRQIGKEMGSDPALNSDRLAGKFATSLGLLASGAGRVHGGARGGGSAQMVEHFRSLLGDSASLPMFLGKMDALDDYLKTYASGPQKATPGGAGGEDDLYSEYLKRTKKPD
jgi:hypothetical protein